MAIETIGQTVRGFDHESLIIHIIAIRKERLKGVMLMCGGGYLKPRVLYL